MNQTVITQKECTDCRALHYTGVSDHAAMGFQIKAKGSAKPSTRKMHPFITKSLSFKAKVKELSRMAGLDELDPVRRLSKHKEILRAAGRQSRNTLLCNYLSSFV